MASAARAGEAGAGGAGAGSGAASGSAAAVATGASEPPVDVSRGLHIFWGSGSPPAWRVLICASEKQLAFSSHLLSFEKRDTKQPWYLKINPRGLVPVLVHDGVAIAESLAILMYLERYYPTVPLLPADKEQCARTLQLVHESNNVSSVTGEVVYYVRRTPPDSINMEYLAAKRAAMHTELALWEAHLQGRTYLVGGAFTMADVAFFPNLAYNVRLGLNISRYPNLHAYYQHMCKRPSVAASWPPHWRGSQGLPILSDAVPSGRDTSDTPMSGSRGDDDSDSDDSLTEMGSGRPAGSS